MVHPSIKDTGQDRSNLYDYADDRTRTAIR